MCKIDVVAFGLNWVELVIMVLVVVAMLAFFCLLVRYLNHTPMVNRNYGCQAGYQPLWKIGVKTPQIPAKKP